MTNKEVQKAELVAATLQWAVGQSSLPAIKDVAHLPNSSMVELADTFTGERFRLTVEEVR